MIACNVWALRLKSWLGAGGLSYRLQELKLICFAAMCHEVKIVNLCASHSLQEELRWFHNHHHLPTLAHQCQGPMCMREKGLSLFIGRSASTNFTIEVIKNEVMRKNGSCSSKALAVHRWWRSKNNFFELLHTFGIPVTTLRGHLSQLTKSRTRGSTVFLTQSGEKVLVEKKSLQG